jgi:hypothetical protein
MNQIRKAIIALVILSYIVCFSIYKNLTRLKTADLKLSVGYVNTELVKTKFYVIATVYNPASFESRYESYRKFEMHMQSFGIKLITVELVFFNQTFRVTKSNQSNHIQLRTNDVLWYKENLINIAIKRLPKECEWIAWIDLEVEFLNQNWVVDTVYALEKYKIVQMFEIVRILGPTRRIIEAHASFGWCHTVNQLNSKSLPYSILRLKYNDTHAYFKWLKTEMYCTSGYGK